MIRSDVDQDAYTLSLIFFLALPFVLAVFIVVGWCQDMPAAVAMDAPAPIETAAADIVK